jgi:hypothetical protein
MRCTPMRCTPHEVHAREVHAREMYAREVHAPVKAFCEDLSASEHRRTSVPAPARVSALSHMGFSHRRSVVKTAI